MGLNFKGRVALTLLSRGAALGLGLVSSVLTARWLGPDGRGLLATLSVVTGLALQFGNPGLHTGNIYFVSRQPHRTAAVLSNTLVVSWAAGILCGALALAALFLRPDLFPGIPWALLLVTAAALPFQFMILLFQNTLLGQGEVAVFNLLETGNKLLTFALLAAWLVLFGGGAAGAVVLFAALAVLNGSISAFACARRTPFRPGFDAGLFAEMLRYGGRVYLACLLAFLVIRSDLLLVNYFLGTAAAGVYSIAVQISDALLLMPVTIGMILLPRIAAETTGGVETTARILRHTTLLLTGLVTVAAILAGPVVRTLYGPGFEGAALATLCLLPGIWALGLNGVLMNHFAGRGMPAVTLYAPLVGLLLNVGLNLVVVPRYGIAGAAVTSSLAYALMLALSLGAFLRSGRIGLRRSLVVGTGEVLDLLGAGRRAA
ncbi:MAG TPA: oligosaccharide flippase family protein [Candidatus Polarisedimenticolia bacterium]|nr:oligosaccharide flippase family protein [Candidatus Polarisedimenticolia bacterium]